MTESVLAVMKFHFHDIPRILACTELGKETVPLLEPLIWSLGPEVLFLSPQSNMSMLCLPVAVFIDRLSVAALALTCQQLNIYSLLYSIYGRSRSSPVQLTSRFIPQDTQKNNRILGNSDTTNPVVIIENTYIIVVNVHS